MKKFYSILAMLMLCMTSAMAVTITKTVGWFESGAVEWTLESGATYTVYYRPEGGTYVQLDKELVRQYPSYGRADMVGLKAGKYQFKVVSSLGSEAESEVFTATAHDRSGFAHIGISGGIGAYKNDGTLKDDAKVLYVTAANAKTISTTVKTGNKSTNITTATGLQNIIYYYQKGYDFTPLDIRIIGTIKADDMDSFESSEEGLQIKGKNNYSEMPITIEGIGFDAAISGFGILVRNCHITEFRNFAIMLCMDDCLSLDTGNSNVWIHNMDFFYGNTGGDADQAKGDGTVDVKGKSMNCTLSYNHFYDAGKSSLGGMDSDEQNCWHTYHHNWFDHSDSRHPRIRSQFFHVYNNYFDGNSKYGIGATTGGSAFVESNYFRNCKYPMLISKQGTDAQGDGTFSGNPGAVIKAFNNVICNPKQVLYYDGKQTDGVWDAVLAKTRDEQVTVTAFSGGSSYNNEADEAARTLYEEDKMDNAADVPAIVRGDLGAGRMGHGDFHWSFNNAIQDPNYGVITELKSALINYKSTLVAYGDGTAAKNAGASSFVDAGDGVGISQEVNDAVIPEWGAGGDTPEEADYEVEPYIASEDDDMFWFGENEATTTQYVTDNVITLGNGSVEGKTSKWEKDFYTTTTSKNVTYTSDHVGAFNLAQASAGGTYDGGSIVFYCPKGVTTFKFNYLRSGSAYLQVSKSTDGVNYSTVSTVDKAAAGVATKDVSTVVRDTESASPMWVKITNGSSGSLYLFGVLIRQLAAGASTLTASDLKAVTTEKSLNIGETFTLEKGTDYTTSSTGAVSYSSNKPAVATIDATGKISAIGEGTATITVAQAKDETYKAGSATMTVTVTDPRAASSFALTSSAEVSLKEAATSQITTSGAAGTVTYASSNTSVATVSATGLITAVAAGSATITVTDPGSASVKSSNATVTVTVTKDMSGKTIVTFSKPSSGKVPVASDPTLVSFGGTTTYKDASYTHDGVTYEKGVKFESATEVYLTPSSDASVTLIFDASTATYMDGEEFTPDANGEYKFSAVGGTKYTLTKKNSVNLYAVIFDFGGSPTPTPDPTPTTNEIYNYFSSIGTTAFMPEGNDTVKASTIKINTNSTSVPCIYLGKSISVVDGNVSRYYVKITPKEGTFKAGDVLNIAGAFNNSDETKKAAIKVLGAASDSIFCTQNFINGRTVAASPTVETYTLTKDEECLYLGRYGNTGTNITTLYVVRAATLKGDVNGDGAVNISDVNAVISVMCGDETYKDSADVNNDGSVNISDVNAVITIMCGGSI